MAGSKSNFHENAVLDAYLSGATVYLALCTSDPGEACTGASCNETANAAGYARQVIAFSAAASGSSSNSATVTFPTATSNYASPITHWAIVTSATYGAGNVRYYGSFNTSKSYSTDDIPQIAAGGITITEG